MAIAWDVTPTGRSLVLQPPPEINHGLCHDGVCNLNMLLPAGIATQNPTS